MVASQQPLDIGVDATLRLAALMKENGLLKTEIDFKAKLFA